MSLALRLHGVSFAYGHAPPVLRDVDLEVARGEFVAIAGPNGGGKTTLVRLIVGLEQPTSGRIELGVDKVGYLAQRAQPGVDAPLTVRELVTAGRAARARLIGPLRDGDRHAVRAAVDRVGLTPQLDRRLATLSGGQQQRAFIAKALAAEPELLVLDEPTTGVDAEAQDAFAALLQQLRGRARGDDPLRVARVRLGRAVRRAHRARARRDRLRRGSLGAARNVARPLPLACLISSSCASRSARASSSACSHRRSASFSCSDG